MAKREIPNLRANDGTFTVEHAYVLQTHLSQFLKIAYGDGMDEIIDQVDPVQMRDDLLTVMSEQALAVLYNNGAGRNILIGLFYGHFILKMDVEEWNSHFQLKPK